MTDIASVAVGGQEMFTDGQLKELIEMRMSGNPRVSKFHMREFLAGRNPFEIPTDPVEQMKVFWKKFFNRDFNLYAGQIPEEKEGPGWLLVMPKGLTYDEVEEVMWKQFKCRKHTNKKISEVIDLEKEVRKTTETYAIRLRDTIEADEVHKNKSANMIKEEGINGITLLERMVLGIFFWWISGKKKHLDYGSCTLCSGSRYLDGNVPYTGFGSGDDRVFICWYQPDRRSDILGVRQVVSYDQQVA
jgi:hypothetical protein